jgi:hypothetical protein
MNHGNGTGPGWRDEIRDLARGLARRARHVADALERQVDRDPYCILGYRGYGTAERALVLGRVLQDEGYLPPEPSQSALRNLINAIKRIESDPLAFARVRTRLGGAVHQMEADDEGFLRTWFHCHARPRPDGIAPTSRWLTDHRLARVPA